MAEIVAMPKLGFDMAEGTLVRWVIAEGQTVSKGAVLAEIETDKATVEVESSFGGVVFKHLVSQGAIVPVGKPIAVIAAAGESVDPSFWQAGTEPGADPAPKKAASSPVKDKANEPAMISAVILPAAAQEQTQVSGGLLVKASPLAKKMASESQLDLGQIAGSGPEGRIVRKDVEAALKAFQLAPAKPGGIQPTAQKSAPVVPEPVFRKFPIPADERIPVNKLRAAIGRRMMESKQSIPHFYVTHDARVDDLLDLRAQWNEIVEDENRLSVNDFVVKAAALCLRQYPNLNSSLKGSEIIRHGHVNIGIAVAVPGGLLTIVCKDADQKTLPEIAREIREMAGRARAGKVRPEDIEGSTFSISNLGMFDVENFAAIINPPESAILAVSSARETVTVEDGGIEVCRKMKLTISADHRVTDGAEAAEFVQVLGKYLAKPLGLLSIA